MYFSLFAVYRQGLDIRGIRIVIQYGACKNLSELIQRAGRAVRELTMSGLFVVMYESWVLDIKLATHLLDSEDPDQPHTGGTAGHPLLAECIHLATNKVMELHIGWILGSGNCDDKQRLIAEHERGTSTHPISRGLNVALSKSKSGLARGNPRSPINANDFYQTVYRRTASIGSLIDAAGHQTTSASGTHSSHIATQASEKHSPRLGKSDKLSNIPNYLIYWFATIFGSETWSRKVQEW